MAFGKKEQEFNTLQDDKEYNGAIGQQKVIAVNLFGFGSGEKNLEKLNNYLANDWIVVQVDEDRQGTMYYLLEKE